MLGLPPELWVSVFGYLSTEEKHAVRCCCRAFKKLVDHPYLWRRYTVVLRDLDRYTFGFWDTLHQRKLTRVAVRHLRRKEWQRLVKFLPALTAIVFVGGGHVYKQKYLHPLLQFPNIRDLGVRDTTWTEPVLGTSLIAHLRDRLTHMSVCNVSLTCTVSFIQAVSQLSNLRYLLFHQQGYDLDEVRPVPLEDFHHMMMHLKKLKHLSWGMRGKPQDPLPDNWPSPPDPRHPGSQYSGPALTTLELEVYPETILPETALWNLTSLKSLTVRYRYFQDGVDCRLNSWLRPLKNLESLSIIGPNSLAVYTTTIPASVTSLTLRVAITLKDLDSIAPKGLSLEHLDIGQNRSNGSLCRCIPTLFPQLRTLRIRFFHREPEKDLLNLHRLRHLERLELLVERSLILRGYLNGHPWPGPSVQELINQLRGMSANRITVVTAMRQRNPLRECNCVWEGDR
ncbi:uncharacterized protein LOC133635810 [Entelurus aequoreus]|uniref:uncharacterized protein LOC133635782 n=1 Tax=Entelurus aequoreus TaxID=161455 RepID=UPI002B1D8F7B|nr:uncharacterized protein LOC133635782 [Entelurus aequoreus]XP_061885045.1 uncharacterized protein LOC133635782 [Entelurus aequoreus]XP_061885047.1 uncharacterized protein LOC133635782 [Entelurus aequoreus]XP_061885105.1 uncharacterized protein LOC133635810 [Entelurus aequoreus]XP_061885106.1 uncharacterized protein LOC133635810 [Entelurus aequoreus]